MDIRWLLLACLVGTAFSDYTEHCGGVDCPRYTEQDSEELNDIDVREYETSKWVALTLAENLSHRQKEQALRTLQGYFTGANSQSLRLANTTPMLKKLETAEDGTETITVMSMVPTAQQANPPTPNDSSLSIVELPAMTIYASELDGRPRRNGNGARRQVGRGNGRRPMRRPNRRGGRRRPEEAAEEDGADSESRAARVRRGGRKQENWREAMQQKIDGMKQALGDRTVVENRYYKAIYGNYRNPRVRKEIWLQAA